MISDSLSVELKKEINKAVIHVCNHFGVDSSEVMYDLDITICLNVSDNDKNNDKPKIEDKGKGNG